MLLWIALNYVSLKYWIQRYMMEMKKWLVVNCFELCIFEILNTTLSAYSLKIHSLWIALNYVSLKYWIQLRNTRNNIADCCELLWIMYLWNIEYNWRCVVCEFEQVVNCFELCIFEILNTTCDFPTFITLVLWIALNYVSLKYWIQLELAKKLKPKGCELLWIMYLWNIEYNVNVINGNKRQVVNCFELCIFEILNTTMLISVSFLKRLWIALNYVSLKYWIQHWHSFQYITIRCELLWIMYLWNIEYNF